jgi:transcriptional regulator with XRE-family HTH domain
MEETEENTEIDWERVGRRIRDRRLRHGLTAEEVAEKAGVTRQTLVRLESGKPCKRATLKKISGTIRIFHESLMRDDPSVDNVAFHDVQNTHWARSRPKSEYQKHEQVYSRYEDDPKERLRLGRLGYQPFFTSILDAELPGGMLNPGMMEIHRPTWVDQHPGEEFVYCMRGRAKLWVRDAEFLLEEGSGLTFLAKEPHQYAPAVPLGPNDPPVLLLIVVALPPNDWVPEGLPGDNKSHRRSRPRKRATEATDEED